MNHSMPGLPVHHQLLELTQIHVHEVGDAIHGAVPDVTRIERFGWRGTVEPGIGRVVSAHGDYYHLVCNEAEGEIVARKKKSAFVRMKTSAPDDMKGAKKSEIRATEPTRPITGDFVKFRYNAHGDSMILEVLPRFSHFERRDPAARRIGKDDKDSADSFAGGYDFRETFLGPYQT